MLAYKFLSLVFVAMVAANPTILEADNSHGIKPFMFPDRSAILILLLHTSQCRRVVRWIWIHLRAVSGPARRHSVPAAVLRGTLRMGGIRAGTELVAGPATRCTVASKAVEMSFTVVIPVETSNPRRIDRYVTLLRRISFVIFCESFRQLASWTLL